MYSEGMKRLMPALISAERNDELRVASELLAEMKMSGSLRASTRVSSEGFPSSLMNLRLGRRGRLLWRMFDSGW